MMLVLEMEGSIILEHIHTQKYSQDTGILFSGRWDLTFTASKVFACEVAAYSAVALQHS